MTYFSCNLVDQRECSQKFYWGLWFDRRLDDRNSETARNVILVQRQFSFTGEDGEMDNSQ
jgi:hypothetical protein